MVNSAFSFTHTHFSRFFCHRFIWENTNPNFTAALEEAVNRNTAGFDLLVGDPAAFQNLNSKFAEVNKIASLDLGRQTGPFASCDVLFFLA